MAKDPGISKTAKSAHEILASAEFRRLVARRWSVSMTLTVVLFVLYYGYVLLIGYNRELLSTKIGEYTTLGIPMGVGVILGAWILTVIYVVWANRVYDPAVKSLKDQLLK